MRLKLREFLFHYIIAKQESYFRHGSRLVLVHACGTECVPRRDIACMNPRKIAANEEASVLKGGRQSHRRARATGTEHEVDHIWILGAPRTRDVFPAPRQREPAAERVTQQDCTTPRRRALHDTDLLVRRHIGVLKVGLNDPVAL